MGTLRCVQISQANSIVAVRVIVGRMNWPLAFRCPWLTAAAPDSTFRKLLGQLMLGVGNGI